MSYYPQSYGLANSANRPSQLRQFVPNYQTRSDYFPGIVQ
jgi:hypothetical protein